MSRILFSYWRSSASYRVRIALALKGLDYETRTINLLAGIQQQAAYCEINPQGLVPFYSDERVSIGQSLAIIEYLDDIGPKPRLLPEDASLRARIRAAAQLIVSDIHPIANLRVLRYLKNALGQTQDAIDNWGRHWIAEGFEALEKTAQPGPYFMGDQLTLADVCLVPQMYNARRLGVDLTPFPKLTAIDEILQATDAVRQSRPEVQPDAA